jgi:7,8-dihydropterin-6-yl-methyl-4-(beta-D-ribofuranosyl)aminobenzene 5'-phosphate synthase
MLSWFAADSGETRPCRSQVPASRSRDAARGTPQWLDHRLIGAFLTAGLLMAPTAAAESTADTNLTAAAPEIVITTVFDNYAVDRLLATSWGFAAVISTPSAALLFDTGSNGATLLSNMKRLHVDPAGIQKVVISHVHDDHVGGLRDFLHINAKVQVFIPRSFPDHVRRIIDAAGARRQDVSEPTRITPGVHTTGPLGTSLQEQALVVETAKGLVVITGCAHPGIVSIVRKAQTMAPKADIALVMGGFHLLSASPGQIEEIVRAFRELGVQRVAPSHCTGDLARSRFRKAYGQNYVDGGAGMVLRFAPPQLPTR